MSPQEVGEVTKQHMIETIEGQSPHKNKTPKVLLHQTLMNFKPTSIQ
jgi:hypothetical protein